PPLLALGELAGAAVAKPAASQADVLILRHRPLCPRSTNVSLVIADVQGEGKRAAHRPPAPQQPFCIRLILNAEAQLEFLLRQARQSKKLEELMMLAPGIKLPVAFDILLGLLPIRNGRECRIRVAKIQRPSGKK